MFRVKVFAQKHDETCMFPLQRNTKNIHSGLYIGTCRISMHTDIYIYDILTCYPRLSTTVCTAEYSSHLSHLTAAISFKLKWHGWVSKTLRFAGTEEIIRNPKNLRKNRILKTVYMIYDLQKR